MIKKLLFLPIIALAAKAMPPEVGAISEQVTFEKFTDSGVANSSLNEQEGKIVILTYFTPW